MLGVVFAGFAAPIGPSVAQAQTWPPAPAPAYPAAGAPSVTVETISGAELMVGVVTADGLVAMLTDMLLEGDQFTVMETTVQSGVSSAAGGARFIIRGAITEYNPAAGGAGVQVGGMQRFGNALGAGAKTRTAKILISLRLINSATGAVVATARAEGKATAQEADAGLLNRRGPGMGVSAFRGTSTGKALEQAMRTAVAELAQKAAGSP